MVSFIIAKILPAVLLVCLFAGCSGKSSAQEEGPPETRVPEPVAPMPEPTELTLNANEPSRVELRKIGTAAWTLHFNRQPFFVKGMGGSDHLDKAAELGANAIRTWGIDGDTPDILERAQKNNLTVTLGYWMGHKRHGFNYHNPQAVARQKQKVLAAVRQYKDHPSLLFWGVGNEVETGQEHDPKVWQAINDVAKAIKEIDPHHPTLIVIAELNGGKNLEHIRDHCPDIDIIGINAYDSAHDVVARYRAFGLGKPCLVTEYGPPLYKKDNFGMVAEPSSTAKAAQYAAIYKAAITDHPDLCLGGYSFIWGSKTEMTDTYFGQLLPGGERLAQAEVFHRLFDSKIPLANRCPHVSGGGLKTTPSSRVAFLGEPLSATFEVADPDGDPLRYRFELKTELGPTVGGDHLHSKKNLGKALQHEGPNAKTVRVQPTALGKYRLYAYAFDGKGNAATASTSVLVKQPVTSKPAPKMLLPHAIYAESGERSAYVASGAMGDKNSAIRMTFDSKDQPKIGKVCLRVSAPAGAWSGMNWQHPANDWGEREGGFDATGATALRFWARGASGGEAITFAIGGIGPQARFSDSAHVQKVIKLSKEWKPYSIDLRGKDLSRIKTPFHWSCYDANKDIVFYLDEVQIVRER